MNKGRCCEASPGREPIAVDSAPRLITARRYGFGIARWLVPGAVLALLPKCPACLAAYVAVGTGFALSTGTASYLRMMLVILCLASLSYPVGRRINRLLAVRPSPESVN